MSGVNATVVLFEGYRERLDDLIGVDTDIDDVERTIEGYALDRENKAALWLWATARRERRHRRASGDATNN